MTENADHSVVYGIAEHSAKGAHLSGFEKYGKLHADSVKDIRSFWQNRARKDLVWEREFDAVLTGSLKEGDVAWFAGGKLNASVQCLDRHVDAGNGDDIAIVYEGDEPGHSQTFTFCQVLQRVCRIANVLRKFGVKKGDPVTIYMPMVPEIAFVMLACVRIG